MTCRPCAEPPSGRDKYPNLRLGVGGAKGRGRLQRQIRRAFIAHGPVLNSSDVYRWCKRWRAREFGQWERWSIVRILDVVADRVGRATTIGRPWIWRLKRPGYTIRAVRLKSLMKLAHGQSCPYCRPWLEL